MEYDVELDVYICQNGKRLMTDHVRHSKSKTGYVSEKTIYKCENCGGCPYKVLDGILNGVATAQPPQIKIFL